LRFLSYYKRLLRAADVARNTSNGGGISDHVCGVQEMKRFENSERVREEVT
jgi:hypothetical protein